MLATLGFDLNIQHPYKPLVEAIKKFNVAKNALAQVAWNFVNDGYDKDLIFGVDKFPTSTCSFSYPFTTGKWCAGYELHSVCNLSPIILQQALFF